MPRILDGLDDRFDLVRADGGVRQFLARVSLDPPDRANDRSTTRETESFHRLHPMFDALLRALSTSSETADRALARSIIASWIEALPVRMARLPSDLYVSYTTIAWLYTVGTFARAVGLAAEARALSSTLRTQPREPSSPAYEVELDLFDYLLSAS